MRNDRFVLEIPKRWVRRAVIALAVSMLVLPAAAWAGHQFTDVPESNTFHEDIDWMKDQRVTMGCNPPENTEYCPENDVTREQMAAFLHRLDTRDVFVTPEEADDDTLYAVVDGQTGDVIASDDLEAAERTGVGEYRLDFAAEVYDCSWTGALGSREGSPIRTSHTLTLNDGETLPDAIFVNIVDPAGDPADHTFNVTVTC